MNTIDLDKNGSISFVEFLRGYSFVEALTGTFEFTEVYLSQSYFFHFFFQSVRASVSAPEAVRKYTPKQMEEIKEIFSLYDKDGNGSISLHEFTTVLQNDLGR